MSTNQNYFGKAIRKRRLEINLSQEELSEKADLHRTYISDVERGGRNISLIALIKVIHALDISVSDFFAKYAIEINTPSSSNDT